MRPNTETGDNALFECLNCGSRASAADGAVCSSCGGELRNLGRSRDL